MELVGLVVTGKCIIYPARIAFEREGPTIAVKALKE
jgi:hypothetical protein